MTLLIATVTAGAVWFSADTLLLTGDDMPNPGDDAYSGGGGPHTAHIVGTCRKVIAGRRVMAMGAGRMLSVTDWIERVTSADDIDAAIKIFPDHRDIGLIAGWSERDNCVRACAFLHGEPVKLTAGAHTMQPGPNAESPHYQAICEAWEPAQRGVKVPEFHSLIARNVNAAYLAGRMRPGIAIGREITTMRLDRAGVNEL